MLQKKNSNPEAIRTGSGQTENTENTRGKTTKKTQTCQNQAQDLKSHEVENHRTLLRFLSPKWLLHLITEANKARRLLGKYPIRKSEKESI